MSLDVKTLFRGYLMQLEVIISKIPAELFSQPLTEDMFSLEMHAKVAANFLLRGYCPLIGIELISFYTDEKGKEAVQAQIAKTMNFLDELKEIESFDDAQILTDKAGFSEIALTQSDFIHKYIVPNYLFHMSMVYATARSCGVALSKGDFDGLHSYPRNFSF